MAPFRGLPHTTGYAGGVLISRDFWRLGLDLAEGRRRDPAESTGGHVRAERAEDRLELDNGPHAEGSRI